MKEKNNNNKTVSDYPKQHMKNLHSTWLVR